MDGPAPNGPPPRLAMPYSCTVENGSVVVRPGPERVFDITGSAEERLFTTCDPPFSNNCRSLSVHKFEIACGLDRVSWPRVVAAIGHTTAGDASVAKGHLVLVREADRSAGHAPSCSDKKKSFAANGECLPWRVRKPTERIVLPQGFAPLREVGARFVDGTAPSVYAAADVMALSPPLPGSGPYRMTPDHGSDDAFEALQQPVAATATSPPGDEHSGGWTTSLSFKSGDEPPPEVVVASLTDQKPPSEKAEQVPATLSYSWLIAILACLGLAGAGFARRSQVLQFATPNLNTAADSARRGLKRAQDGAREMVDTLHSRFAVTSNAEEHAEQQEGPSDPALSSALLQLKAMLARTEAAVAMLSSTAVVREVMQSELTAIRARLDDAERASRRGSTPVMKLAAQFRQIARDIDRVQNITQSASQSFSLHAPAMAVPTTVADAYALIGIEQGDGELVAKKVIDTLRMSSHPDHARDETDRLDREARIKQINVAYDLITGRRRPT